MKNDESRRSYYEGNTRLIKNLTQYNEVLKILEDSDAIKMVMSSMQLSLDELNINLNHLIEFAECEDDGQEMEINHLTNGRKIIQDTEKSIGDEDK